MLEVLEKHVLGAGEADTFSAHFAGLRAHLSAYRRWRAHPIRAHRDRPISLMVSYAFGGSAETRCDLASVDGAIAAVEREPFTFFYHTAVHADAFLLEPSISSLSAPTMQHFPSRARRRATWLVFPPVAVRIPCATFIPPTSSGLVSRRTRITFSPLAAHSSAACGCEYRLSRLRRPEPR